MQQIREAVESDAAAINALNHDLGYDMGSQEEAVSRIKKIIVSEFDQLWVFEENTKILGWIHCFIAVRAASPPFAEIGGLVVSAEYRRKGIGKQLVEVARRWARTKDLKLRVRSNMERKESHHFYHQLGFSKIKTQHVYEVKA